MDQRYSELVARISRTYGLQARDVERRVEARHALFSGLLSRRAAARIVSAQTRIEHLLGARHVTGLAVTDAIAAARAEANRGHASTLGYWCHPDEAAPLVASHYLRAIDAIAEAGLEASISIKVDRFERERALLSQVLRLGRQRGVRVHFDADGYHSADCTFSLLEEGLAMGAAVSATLPSRWARSARDAERLVAWGVPFRIVKGQGKDPDQPRIDPCRSFLDLVAQVAGRASHVAVATHDRRVAEPALERLLAARTPCSLEQLRSLPRLDFLAKERAVRVRVYVAYGRSGLPYALGQVVRRPAILAWLLRDLLVR